MNDYKKYVSLRQDQVQCGWVVNVLVFKLNRRINLKRRKKRLARSKSADMGKWRGSFDWWEFIISAEGSWIQGGSRAAGGAGAGAAGPGSGSTQGAQGPPINIGSQPGHTEGPSGGRPNLGPSPGMGMGQAGPHGSQNNQNPLPSGPHQVGPNMHHYRGLIPPFVSIFYITISGWPQLGLFSPFFL